MTEEMKVTLQAVTKDDLTKLGKELAIHEFEMLAKLIRGCTGVASNPIDQEFTRSLIKTFEIEIVARALGMEKGKRESFLKEFLQAMYQDCKEMLDGVEGVI